MDILKRLEEKDSRSKSVNKFIKHMDLYLVGGVMLLTLIFALVYVLRSKIVYFWDNSTYWDIGRMLAQKPLNFDMLKEVYVSIGTSDYNYFLAFPVALWMKIFGITRISYILAIIVMYVVPTEILIFLMCKKISKAPRFAYVITVLIIPALTYLAVIGFIDVACVFLGLLCYYLYFTDVLSNHKCIKSVIIGILLVFVMISRRYFAFFAVSFLTVIAIDAILFKRDIKHLIITVVTTVAVLLICFYPFFTNILLKDYGTLYAGYKYSFGTDMKLITRYFGLIFLLFLVVAVIYSAVKNKNLNAVLALLQAVVCAVMFISTQTHGQQHLLLYIPSLVYLVIICINSINKIWMLLLVIFIAISNTVSPAIKRVQPQNIQEIKHIALFPKYSVTPPKREDINDIIALKRALDKKIPEGETCGVLSSSFVLNSSILINAMPSLNLSDERTDNYIVGLPEVDSRDYWRLNEIYNCDYILVAYPAQIHLPQNEQTIVTEAVSSFANNTDVSNAFECINDFAGKVGDIDVKLYKRIRNVHETEKTEYKLKLYK